MERCMPVACVCVYARHKSDSMVINTRTVIVQKCSACLAHQQKQPFSNTRQQRQKKAFIAWRACCYLCLRAHSIVNYINRRRTRTGVKEKQEFALQIPQRCHFFCLCVWNVYRTCAKFLLRIISSQSSDFSYCSYVCECVCVCRTESKARHIKHQIKIVFLCVCLFWRSYWRLHELFMSISIKMTSNSLNCSLTIDFFIDRIRHLYDKTFISYETRIFAWQVVATRRDWVMSKIRIAVFRSEKRDSPTLRRFLGISFTNVANLDDKQRKKVMSMECLNCDVFWVIWNSTDERVIYLAAYIPIWRLSV